MCTYIPCKIFPLVIIQHPHMAELYYSNKPIGDKDYNYPVAGVRRATPSDNRNSSSETGKPRCENHAFAAYASTKFIELSATEDGGYLLVYAVARK